jgi:hypothetical protein
MTNKEAIKYLQQLYPNGGHCWLDDKRIEAVGMAIKALQKEPVSEDLEEAASRYAKEEYSRKSPATLPDRCKGCYAPLMYAFKAGAEWQKENLWKPADGEDLPEINREVIALLGWGKVVFAHRPPEYWDGKDIVTGKVTRHYPKTYDKGGWNIPDVKYWLDVELPKEIEL